MGSVNKGSGHSACYERAIGSGSIYGDGYGDRCREDFGDGFGSESSCGDGAGSGSGSGYADADGSG